MPDVVDRKTRSRMMSGIRGKDTKPEITIRRNLHRLGFRYRLHDRKLPGRPDMVFPKHRAVIHIHGCFWHWHDCHLFKWPATRPEFWREKITGNRDRDMRNAAALDGAGWRQMVIWECALKGKTRRPLEEVVSTVADWLAGLDRKGEISGV